MPSRASRSRSHSATSQHCTMVAGAPGSRSKTIRSASSGVPTSHWWVWNSATRLAAHIRLGRSCTSTIRDGPSTRGTSAVMTHSGVPGGTFLLKKTCPSGPSGYRRKDTARSRRCGSRTSATVA